MPGEEEEEEEEEEELMSNVRKSFGSRTKERGLSSNVAADARRVGVESATTQFKARQ